MKSLVLVLSLIASSAHAQQRTMVEMIQAMKPEPPMALQIMESPLAKPDGRTYAMRVTLFRQEKDGVFLAKFAYPKGVVSRVELLARNARAAHATNRNEKTEKVNNDAQELVQKYRRTYYMVVITTAKTEALQPVRLDRELLVLGQY